mmetsp:Transcript_31940/g.49897  ORF Transcript_31940/g.49897 Transcript_31940/m.49897 type:complete len:355 (-) Transcript_31940:1577-2641(-)
MIQLTQFLSLLALFGSSAAFSPLGSSPPELLGGSACRLLSPVTSRPSTPSAGLRGLRSELGEVQRTDTFASRHEPHRLRPRLSASSLYPEDSALYDEYYLDSTSEVGRKKQREGVWRHLFHMTRPKAIPGEIALSLVGSWLAVHSVSGLLTPMVWLVAMASVVTGMASMVVNDYFDYKAGVDSLKPKPLVLGTVEPEQALMTAVLLYMFGLVLSALCLDPFPLRALVSSSLLITFLYTPLLKRIPLVKNLSVACVIALAITAGGMAAGALGGGLVRTIVPTTYVFLTILWQEIVMDIDDAQGDSAAGLKTLPVVVGKPASLTLALACAILAGLIAGVEAGVMLRVSGPLIVCQR